MASPPSTYAGTLSTAKPQDYYIFFKPRTPRNKRKESLADDEANEGDNLHNTSSDSQDKGEDITVDSNSCSLPEPSSVSSTSANSPVVSSSGGSPLNGTVGVGFGVGATTATANSDRSPSTSIRHPLDRPLSPDLPTKDALYLFVNFASYMQSPSEHGEGIESNDDFKDTIRLLDYARMLRGQPYSNVHLLHLKYRFQNPQRDFRSPYSTGDYILPINYRDQNGRLRNPVPQPFSTLHDPVIKVDYKENGVFQPLPAQAVFSHIATFCQPPPRIIVISYVSSRVIENHLASISQWALTSSPPSYVFSPLETRLRETRPLHEALQHAIPMSMYAYPPDVTPSNPPFSTSTSFTSLSSPSSSNAVSWSRRLPSPHWERGDKYERESTTPLHSPKREHFSRFGPVFSKEDPTNVITSKGIPTSPPGPGSTHAQGFKRRRASGGSTSSSAGSPASPLLARSESKGYSRRHRDEPVASLTVISGDASQTTTTSPVSGSPSEDMLPSVPAPPPADRIPLWALAPGVGVLHGSTSASIGVKLVDFSAINLATEDPNPDAVDSEDEEAIDSGSGIVPIGMGSQKPGGDGKGVITASEADIRVSSIEMPDVARPLPPPVEAPERPRTPAKNVPLRAGVHRKQIAEGVDGTTDLNAGTVIGESEENDETSPVRKVADQGSEVEGENKQKAVPTARHTSTGGRTIQMTPSEVTKPIVPSTIHLTPPDRPPIINHLSPPNGPLQPGRLTPPDRPTPRILTSGLQLHTPLPKVAPVAARQTSYYDWYEARAKEKAQAQAHSQGTTPLTSPGGSNGEGSGEEKQLEWKTKRQTGGYSWPSPVNKVSGWKKGRKEQMEDTLEGLSLVGDLVVPPRGSVGSDRRDSSATADADGATPDAKEGGAVWSGCQASRQRGDDVQVQDLMQSQGPILVLDTVVEEMEDLKLAGSTRGDSQRSMAKVEGRACTQEANESGGSKDASDDRKGPRVPSQSSQAPFSFFQRSAGDPQGRGELGAMGLTSML